VFIERDRRAAAHQVRLFAQRLAAGHRLVVFPEGTSTDGQQVLPFKPTLFAAFLPEPLRDRLWIQPVSVIYRVAPGDDPRRYAWWGDMDFGPHLLAVLGARRQGSVTVVFHPPLRVAAHPDRKTLARLAELRVRDGVAARVTRPPESP
jgi:1-acyl-sn-glycerol-3-phosphate acyltransferase